MKKFDREFEKDRQRALTFAIAGFIFNVLLTLAVLGGIGFVVFKVLSHFGIM